MQQQILASFASSKNMKMDSAQSWLAVREAAFADSLRKTIQSLPAPKFGAKLKKPRKNFQKREVNVCISDTHFGSDLVRADNLDAYGVVEESRRMARVVAEVSDYKPQYRSVSSLRVHLIGDIIQGKLHDMADGDKLINQFSRAFHILRCAIAQWAAKYPEVVVECQTGNHGRDKARHEQRAVIDKFDSNEGHLYMALAEYFRDVPNVKFNVWGTAFYIWDSFGTRGFATHGDTVLNVGYVGKSVNTAAILGNVQKINDGLKTHDMDCKMFIAGHVHVPCVVKLSNGVNVCINGALVPSDRFAKSIGLFSSATVQQVWESVPGHIMGDHRAIEVGVSDDKDSSLDKIIPIWKPTLKGF